MQAFIVLVCGAPGPPFIMASTRARASGGILASWSGLICGILGIDRPEIWLVVVFSQRPGLTSIGLISCAHMATGHIITMANKIFFTSATLLRDNGIS